MMGISLFQIVLLLGASSVAHARNCATDILRMAVAEIQSGARTFDFQNITYRIDPHLKAVPISHGGKVDSWKIIHQQHGFLYQAKDVQKWGSVLDSGSPAHEIKFEDGSRVLEVLDENGAHHIVRIQREMKKPALSISLAPEARDMAISVAKDTPNINKIIYLPYLEKHNPRIAVVIQKEGTKNVTRVYDSNAHLVDLKKVKFSKNADGNPKVTYFDSGMNRELEIEHFYGRTAPPQKFQVFDANQSRLEYHQSALKVRYAMPEYFDFHPTDFIELVNSAEIKNLEREVIAAAKASLKLDERVGLQLNKIEHREALYQVMTRKIDDQFGQEISPYFAYDSRAKEILSEKGLMDVLKNKAAVCKHQTIVGHVLLARLGLPSETVITASISHAFLHVEGKILDFNSGLGKGVWGARAYSHLWPKPDKIVEAIDNRTQFITIEPLNP